MLDASVGNGHGYTDKKEETPHHKNLFVQEKHGKTTWINRSYFVTQKSDN